MQDLSLYVIRHGQTDYNREGRLQGARDIPLNELGRGQARGNGRQMATLPGFDPDAHDWVASPLSRTRETMELVRENAGLSRDGYRTDDLLIELSFGDWEGRTMEEIEHDHPGVDRSRDRAKWDFCPPGDGAESYEMLAKRIDRFLSGVSGPSVIVAHGGVIRALFNRIGGIDGNAAAMLDIPQDRILRIEGGKIGWI
jgi:broad specificity phosphatase PhoE